jgi:hypothetical protein
LLFTPKCEINEFSPKRIAASLGAFAMPDSGVDEHLETTVGQFNYWQEMDSLLPVDRPEPVKVKCSINRFNLCPQLSITDC